MVVKTRNPVERHIMQQNTVVTTANGLPVDSTVSVEGTRRLLVGDDQILGYDGETVTLDPKYDLNVIRTTNSRYTGQLVLIDSDNTLYYIDRISINGVNNTFKIYTDQTKAESPDNIELEAGWIIAEAKLINRLATTSAAHIDEVVFNGFDVQLKLDGSDQIQVVGPTGNVLQPNADGSINANTSTDADEGDNIAISRHEKPFRHLDNKTLAKAQLDTSIFTEVFSYTAVEENLRVSTIKVQAATIGIFRVRIDGLLVDQFKTSPENRNCIIKFSEDEDLPLGQSVTVEFLPERLRMNEYFMFLRLEGYFQP